VGRLDVLKYMTGEHNIEFTVIKGQAAAQVHGAHIKSLGGAPGKISSVYVGTHRGATEGFQKSESSSVASADVEDATMEISTNWPKQARQSGNLMVEPFFGKLGARHGCCSGSAEVDCSTALRRDGFGSMSARPLSWSGSRITMPQRSRFAP
jgi:hypothetical protein